eukprot:6449657-Pyramimonas_sp.AAC.2
MRLVRLPVLSAEVASSGQRPSTDLPFGHVCSACRVTTLVEDACLRASRDSGDADSAYIHNSQNAKGTMCPFNAPRRCQGSPLTESRLPARPLIPHPSSALPPPRPLLATLCPSCTVQHTQSLRGCGKVH